MTPSKTSLFAFVALFATVLSPRVQADFELLSKGQTNEHYTGYLISKEKEKQLRLMDQQLDNCKEINLSHEKLKDLNDQFKQLSDQRLENYKLENTHLADRLAKAESNKFWENTLYFGLGVLVTGFIAYGAVQVTR